MEVVKLEWVLSIGLGAVTVIWLAMEIATVDDKGKGFIFLFVVAGVI